MQLDAKPNEENIVIVHDKYLMAALGAKGIKPILICASGWPVESPEYKREKYMAFRHKLEVQDYIDQFERHTLDVNLKEFLDHFSEFEAHEGMIVYSPKQSYSSMANALADNLEEPHET
jgi:hypothetical protein